MLAPTVTTSLFCFRFLFLSLFCFVLFTCTWILTFSDHKSLVTVPLRCIYSMVLGLNLANANTFIYFKVDRMTLVCTPTRSRKNTFSVLTHFSKHNFRLYSPLFNFLFFLEFSLWKFLLFIKNSPYHVCYLVYKETYLLRCCYRNRYTFYMSRFIHFQHVLLCCAFNI